MASAESAAQFADTLGIQSSQGDVDASSAFVKDTFARVLSTVTTTERIAVVVFPSSGDQVIGEPFTTATGSIVSGAMLTVSAPDYSETDLKNMLAFDAATLVSGSIYSASNVDLLPAMQAFVSGLGVGMDADVELGTGVGSISSDRWSADMGA